MMNTKLQIGLVVAAILVLAIFRLLPHPPNATPVATMALFAGAYFSNRFVACGIPLIAMLLSDIVIGFHTTMLYVYFGMLVTVFVGMKLTKLTTPRLGSAVLFSSLIFFFVTNLGAWLHHDLYPHTFSGLQQAYIAGLPFLRNAVIANFIFSYIVFYSFGWVITAVTARENVQAS